MAQQTPSPITARARTARRRFWIMVAVGIVVALITGFSNSWWHAPAAGWGAAALLYDVWVWARISRMDAAQTRVHAREEDPRRTTRDFLILCANAAAIVAVLIVMVSGNQAEKPLKIAIALLALLVVGASWLMLHTLFTLRYAELYYTSNPEGGIEFNQGEPPQYTDIAYMAFSLGMTYQVSDTAITSHAVRAEALKHSLLAYVFATLILAATINLVIGLAS
ncbi:DUF1345 domain-containing protein [Sinomonas sp. JGH33]|uniref:DUF1345 domain-containing protein n=1 Tax=Sinomonas terricola TaxID=3110330 RepID=A0ABU5T771_9MICC|nr:DUF1345 domain-containing protein [Sinomonas sp. JGH33]MEA5455512.1 DUF1345 domain-containing protein [Sinomonas sp. JGH33]